jgi:predicted MPP superfamily phosphohydrolase
MGSMLLAWKVADDSDHTRYQYRMFQLASLFLLFYFPKLIFIGFNLLEDLVRAISFIIGKLKIKPDQTRPASGTAISRMDFITKSGLFLASLPFFSILYGTASGRFDFTIRRVMATFPNLPNAFKGFRLVQISDLHIGSFYGHYDQLERAVDMINDLDADLVVFTGDMVNDYSGELQPCIPILKRLHARYGMYSILGNHDYGDYHSWASEQEKQENLDALKKYQEQSGFQLLLNDSATIHLGDDRIALVGVENWGKPPFAQYGDLEKAIGPVRDIPFKILLSHDPSHWDAEVLDRTDVALTLSGHTHGFQFGIEKGNLQWSPVQYRYPRWAGLYREGVQQLYVNRGLGCIGYMGRVGIHPEITLLELST